jgi:two-component system, OmpR family, KDP operon response regulator KdpE
MSESQGKILIVEDDSALRRSLRTTLEALGFETDDAVNGEEALTLVIMNQYEAVLLDVNMPGMGGIETCLRIRRTFTRLPIVLLTVRDSEDDKVNALDAGADDYITKPFQIRELTARLRAAVRRFRAPAMPAEAPITIGEITLDPLRRRVTKAGLELHLTPREFKTMHLLMEHAGRPITHARLLSALWGPGYGDEREYLRVLMSTLRKKVERDSGSPEYLLTESYVGYRFREE